MWLHDVAVIANSQMKMKKLLLGVCLLCSLDSIAAPFEPAAYVGKELNKLVDLYKDGFGYNSTTMRHIAFGPLFSTERQDAVAFFGLTGVDNSNGHYEYIAIFAKGKGRDFNEVKGPKDRPFNLVLTALVGSRSTRTLDWNTVKISQGKIVVQGTRWSEDDPGCCPTKPIEVTFNIPLELGIGSAPGDYPVIRESEVLVQIAPAKDSLSGKKEKKK